MIPFRDSVRTRAFPWVNLSLIGLCFAGFLVELSLGPQLDSLINRWGVTPSLVTQTVAGQSGGDPLSLLTLITSQFLHGGWIHLGSNMLFLWIFGDNVEDRLGHIPYLLFYLACGALAGLAQAFLLAESDVPVIGASGAIAAVLGAYLVFYPRAWVTVLVPLFFFLWPLELPVVIVLGFWLVSQLASGLAAITEASQATGGIAWWAHVAGFAAGALAALLLARRATPTRLARAGTRAGGELGPFLRWLTTAVTLAADAAQVLIALRLVFRFFTLEPVGPLGFAVDFVYTLTGPLVKPFSVLLPSVDVGGHPLELHSLLALAVYHILLLLFIWGLTAASGGGSPRARRRSG